MILKFFQFILIFLFLSISPLLSNSDISIEAMIEDELITNYDINKESEYLKILNNNLQNLNDEQLRKIAKKNLITEAIKKKELLKFFDLNKKNPLIDQVFENLYKKIGFQNDKEFNLALKKLSNYTEAEIKQKLKIEVYWNDLIYLKYKDQIIINKIDLENKLNKKSNETKNQYLLSEIVFEKKIDTDLNDQINKIKNSINDIGFNNTANIYSISQSSNFGGKIDWIDENNLSQTIFENLKNIQIGEYTNVIQIGNNYIILKVEDKRVQKINFDKKVELKKMMDFEKMQQLNIFSNIYFNKAKMNYIINEK